AVAALYLQHVVARRFLRLARTVVEERANAGIGPDDIVAPDGLGEIFAGRSAKIVDFRIADANTPRIALIVAVGRTDQRELFLIGNGEHDTPVRVLEEVGARIGELLLHHDVAALHEADIVH